MYVSCSVIGQCCHKRRWTLRRNQSYVRDVAAFPFSCSMTDGCMDSASVQSQKAVTAHLKSEQLLPFDFARQRGRK